MDMSIFACKMPLTSGISMQAGADYFHAVQSALILELKVREKEMQTAELRLSGTAPCKCGHPASRPRVARGCCSVWPSQFKPPSARCSIQPNAKLFPSWKKISYSRSDGGWAQTQWLSGKAHLPSSLDYFFSPVLKKIKYDDSPLGIDQKSAKGVKYWLDQVLHFSFPHFCFLIS